MSVSSAGTVPEINLEEFERRLRAAGAAPSGAEDPLAELTRLVTMISAGRRPWATRSRPLQAPDAERGERPSGRRRRPRAARRPPRIGPDAPRSASRRRRRSPRRLRSPRRAPRRAGGRRAPSRRLRPSPPMRGAAPTAAVAPDGSSQRRAARALLVFRDGGPGRRSAWRCHGRRGDPEDRGASRARRRRSSRRPAAPNKIAAAERRRPSQSGADPSALLTKDSATGAPVKIVTTEEQPSLARGRRAAAAHLPAGEPSAAAAQRPCAARRRPTARPVAAAVPASQPGQDGFRAPGRHADLRRIRRRRLRRRRRQPKAAPRAVDAAPVADARRRRRARHAETRSADQAVAEVLGAGVAKTDTTAPAAATDATPTAPSPLERRAAATKPPRRRPPRPRRPSPPRRRADGARRRAARAAGRRRLGGAARRAAFRGRCAERDRPSEEQYAAALGDADLVRAQGGRQGRHDLSRARRRSFRGEARGAVRQAEGERRRLLHRQELTVRGSPEAVA